MARSCESLLSIAEAVPGGVPAINQLAEFYNLVGPAISLSDLREMNISIPTVSQLEEMGLCHSIPAAGNLSYRIDAAIVRYARELQMPDLRRPAIDPVETGSGIPAWGFVLVCVAALATYFLVQ